MFSQLHGMAATVDQVDLYIKHVVEIHSDEMVEHEIELAETDSGRSSLMPGADLSQDAFTEEFSSSPSDIVSHPYTLGLSEFDSDNSSQASVCPPPTKKQAKQRLPRRRSLVIPDDWDLDLDPPLAMKLEETKECMICTGEITMNNDLVTLKCCNTSICKDCITATISTKVNDGLTYIPCPNPNCTKALQRDFIVSHIMDDEILLKYERFRLNAEGDDSQKTCPNCCYITKSHLPVFKAKKQKALTPDEYNITCSVCDFQWCFNCHSPWHEGISCRLYREGDKQFMKWTKGRKVGYTPNCQRCPKCKVYIERSTGCDSMTCNRCHANFCYKCGGTFSGFPGLGNHYKHLSVYGCPYNYLPEKNTKRRFIRGGYLFTKCAALTGYPIVLVGGVAVIAVGAVIILPIVGGVITYKVIRRKRRGY